MKKYLKYLLLFLILIFIGIVSVNLYNTKNVDFQSKKESLSSLKDNSSKDNGSKDKDSSQNNQVKDTAQQDKDNTSVNNAKGVSDEEKKSSSSNAGSNSTQEKKSETSDSKSSVEDSLNKEIVNSDSSSSDTTNDISQASQNAISNTEIAYNEIEVVDDSLSSSGAKGNVSSAFSINTDQIKSEQSNFLENSNVIDVDISSSSSKTNVDVGDTNSDTNSSVKNDSKTTSNDQTLNSNSNIQKEENSSLDSATKSLDDTSFKEMKDGDIVGATGYGVVPEKNYLRSKAKTNSKVITKIEMGIPFRIISKSKNDLWWKVSYQGKVGYVENSYCLINLPDYIPSITYYIVDALKDNSVSSGVKLSVYGKKLYSTGKVYNPRLGKDEYIVPVTYDFAKKILSAQSLALKDGYSLKIYDAYRPTSVANKVRDSLAELYSQNATVRKNIDYSYENGEYYEWGKSWFIAQNLSAHSLASAIDVSLTKKGETKSLKMPSKVNELSTKAIKYRYGVSGQTTVRNDLYSGNMTSAAKKLDSYMMKSGLTSLASEWWHFQDNTSYSRMKSYIPSGLNFQPSTIASAKSE